jgi:hypothetical protein
MRCFFLRNGHIAGVEMLSGLSDQEATAKAQKLFLDRRGQFEGFEVWDRTRVVFRHPDPDSGKPEAGQPAQLPAGPHDDVAADLAGTSSAAELVRDLRIEPDADQAVGATGRQRDVLRRLDHLITPPG